MFNNKQDVPIDKNDSQDLDKITFKELKDLIVKYTHLIVPNYTISVDPPLSNPIILYFQTQSLTILDLLHTRAIQHLCLLELEIPYQSKLYPNLIDFIRHDLGHFYLRFFEGTTYPLPINNPLLFGDPIKNSFVESLWITISQLEFLKKILIWTSQQTPLHQEMITYILFFITHEIFVSDVNPSSHLFIDGRLQALTNEANRLPKKSTYLQFGAVFSVDNGIHIYNILVSSSTDTPLFNSDTLTYQGRVSLIEMVRNLLIEF